MLPILPVLAETLKAGPCSDLAFNRRRQRQASNERVFRQPISIGRPCCRHHSQIGATTMVAAANGRWTFNNIVVCFWPLADMAVSPTNVRFWAKRTSVGQA